MEKPLTEKDWGELQNVLHGRDFKWQAIGIQLHVAHNELTRIKEEHGQNLEECNREMQIAWLKSGRATWRALVAALGAGPVGLLEDAKRLEEKHLGVRIIQSATSASGSHGDLVECNSENLVVNQPVQKSLLNEQLEWLIKMGFTVEDIMEWAQQAKKKRLCNDEATFNNSSTNNNNDNDNSSILFCANSESPQEHTCSSDSTMLTSSTHAHTEPLQETPPTLSPPPPALSDPLRRLSTVTPMDGGEALTPGGAGRKILRKGCPRKRANSSQGKQPKAKRERTSKAALSKGEASSSRGRLRSPLRLSVEKGRQKAITLLKEEMMEVLDQIEQHPAAKEFIEPVDRRRATNYSDVIAEPMCLADMATKVFEGIYKTPKMFCDDFNLIISNCEAYNGAESEYMQEARQLEAEFYHLVDNYFDDSEIDVQRHHSKTTTPPQGPTTSSPGAGGKGTYPKTPRVTGEDGGSSGSLAADVVIQDDEREEIPAMGSDQDYGIGGASNCCVTVLYCRGVEGGGSGSGLEERETWGQLPRPCPRLQMIPGSSGDETAGDSEDDLPSFRNIFSTPSKIE